MVAALYRRYRPESFSEMIGQSQVTEPLMTALRNGRVGHAYLFSGPRGCGKTTSARILARCLNCAEGPTDNPCGVCPSCIELSRDGGGSLDVVEIDAASHGGVDDARDLRERAVFAPARDRFKIFIIDEAHMVTSAGFNALLKIVEEPPPHVKFVFATTEPEKVIGTIRSRTHHYPFRLIAPGTLIDYVQTLCDSEGVQIEPGVLSLVVRAGGGSARDTLSILDQLIAGSEGNLVTADRAAGLLGFTGSELLDDVVTAFGAHDAAAAFYATDRVVQTGQDPRRFVEDLLERLRDLIVVTATTVEGAAAVFRGVPQDQLTRMFEQAQRFGSGELSRIADVTSDTLNRMVGATAPRLQLELMIARALVGLDELRAAAAAPAGMPRGGAQQGQQQAQSEQGQQAPQAQQPNQMQQAQMQQRQGQGSAQPAPAQHPGQFVAPGQQRVQPQPQAQAPAQPQAPAQDPISALAAARGAVTQQSAPQTGAPQQPEPQTGAPQGAPTPLAASQGTAAPTSPETAPGAPNAAQTAASVRDFLREDTSGAQQDIPAGQPQPQQAQVAPAQTAPEQPAQQQPVPAQPATPAQSAPAQAAQAPHDPSKPHPNEGAAGFGRSISAVLSAAQIASIGAEPTKPLKPATPAAQPNPAQQPAQAQGVPGQPGATAQPGAAQASSAQPAEQAPGQPASQPHEPQGVPAAGPVDGQPVDGVDSEIADDAEGGLSDLLEVWPDLLEEILEQDRAAWNAVKSVQPLALEGDVLAVGIASRSDLEAFKASGAGPLREAILSAVGITVRYVPRPIPQGGAPAAPADEPAEPAAEEPHRAPPAGAPASATQASVSTAPPSGPPAAAQVNDNDPVARAAARLSALGPALAAPAWADPVPEAPATVAAPAAQAPAAQTPVPEATVPQPTVPEATASQATASQAITSQDSAPTLAQKSEPAQAEAPELAPAGAAPGQEPASDVSTGGGAPATEPTSARAAGSSEQPQKAANQSAQPAMDDPYANDPYAGEPSDDSYDDPYASGQGGGFTPAAPPAQSTAAAQVAPAQQVADPEPQRAPQPAAASQAPAPQAPGQASAPTFTRYGESVVRETLGARFLEELPLAPPAPLD